MALCVRRGRAKDPEEWDKSHKITCLKGLSPYPPHVTQSQVGENSHSVTALNQLTNPSHLPFSFQIVSVSPCEPHSVFEELDVQKKTSIWWGDILVCGQMQVMQRYWTEPLKLSTAVVF